MKEIELIEQLKEKAVFSVQDIQRAGHFSRQYAKLALNRLVKRKLIKNITRNRYTIQDDIMAVASNIKLPGYISFWSALSYYGFTEQILNTIYIACTIRAKPVLFNGYKIKFIKIKDFFGYKKIKAEKGDIFIAEPEKLLIDCLLYPKETGNFDEIEKVFQKADISEEKLVSYLKRVNNMSLIKRIGFMLERYSDIDISSHFKMDRNYVLLNQFSKKYKNLNSKWRIKS